MPQAEPLYEHLPVRLRSLRQWVYWRYEERDGRKLKVPLRKDGRRASVVDESHWSTYGELMSEQLPSFADGIGFVLTKDDPYVGIDLDRNDATSKGVLKEAHAASAYIERSISGRGWHIIGEVRQFSANLNRSREYGIELYSHSRYFIMTGTLGGGKPATGTPDADISALVERLARLVGGSEDAPIKHGLESYDNGEENIARAIEWLKSRAPAIEGQGGDHWTYKTAAWLRDFGLSPDTATKLMAQHWNDRCVPSWEQKELAEKVANAYRYSQNAVGGKNPKAVFDDLDELEEPKEDKKGPPMMIELLRADKVAVEPIDWLWKGWLAKGKLHILAGPAGVGKTTVTLSLAARLTAGLPLPDGSQAPPQNVLIWSGEDDPADTLVPRLMAAGANLKRVSFLRAALDMNTGEYRPFSPSQDIPRLAAVMQHIGNVGLVILDPILQVVRGDSHKASEVRQALQPIVDFAQKYRCTVIGITHFGKGMAGRSPLERVMGSQAFGALARIVLACIRLPDDDLSGYTRALCRIKSNIGPDDGAYGYDLQHLTIDASGQEVETSYVDWGDHVEGTGYELLARADSAEEARLNTAAPEVDDAVRFLLAELQDGEVPVKSIRKSVKEAGLRWSDVERAKARLGVERIRQGGEWCWRMPDDFEDLGS